MTIKPDDKRLTFLPEDQASKTKGHVFAYHDYTWCVCLERGLILFNGHAQANSNPALSQDLRNRLYPWAESKLVPLALIREQ